MVSDVKRSMKIAWGKLSIKIDAAIRVLIALGGFVVGCVFVPGALFAGIMFSSGHAGRELWGVLVLPAIVLICTAIPAWCAVRAGAAASQAAAVLWRVPVYAAFAVWISEALSLVRALAGHMLRNF
jgi:hypothetical protein